MLGRRRVGPAGIRLTADHVLILFHDEILDRICGVPGRIHEFEFAELAALSAYEPGRFSERFRGEAVASAVGELLGELGHVRDPRS